MTKIGKLYICDRCENTGFAGYIGGIDRSGWIDQSGWIDRSGWIDPFGKFEKLEGWEICEGKTLCPDCAQEYHMRLRGFWKEKKE